MPDSIEQQTEKQDTSKDPNEGKTMLDFVKASIGTEEEKRSNAQELSKTEEEEESKLAVEDGEKSDVDLKDEEEATVEPGEDEGEEGDKKKKDGEKEEQETTEEEEEAATESKEEPKGPVPYERFEEVNNKYKVTVEEFEKVKPIAEAHNKIVEYCNANNITQDQFAQVLEIQALLNSDPQKALEKILPIVEAVQGFTGDKLPSDLQSKVDTGKIELADAREIARLRAERQFGTNRFQQYQQIQQQRAQREFQDRQVSAINAWTASKQKSDPDFKPRATKEAPKGRFEFVYDAVQALLAERDANGQLVHQIKTPQDVPAILEQAYQEVVRSLAPMHRKPATKKQLSHNGSTSRNTEVKIENAKSMKEAIQIAAASHGL